MKVFLSWSGTRSHKIALVFRDWLPSVIQEIVPYVSSEDIDKGARWSTDIAKELSDSTFGVLCVTRENINAPWLTFEAGALSKTMDKSFVSPFLFDIKRSEVDGPILQFQSTVFDKEDLKKLVVTLNRACDKDGLTADRLGKAFEVWYPTLEAELNNLKGAESAGDELDGGRELDSPQAQEILEEILELSRSNQKLIRNPDGSLGSSLEEIAKMVQMVADRLDRSEDPCFPQRMRKYHPIMLDELLQAAFAEGHGYVGIQIALGTVRTQIPWVYDAGMEALNILRSRRNLEERREAVQQFKRIMDFTAEHPMMREFVGARREIRFVHRRLPDMLMEALERNTRR